MKLSRTKGRRFLPGSYHGWLTVAKRGQTWWTSKPAANMYIMARLARRRISCKEFMAFSLKGFGLKNGESVRLVRVMVLK